MFTQNKILHDYTSNEEDRNGVQKKGSLWSTLLKSLLHLYNILYWEQKIKTEISMKWLPQHNHDSIILEKSVWKLKIKESWKRTQEYRSEELTLVKIKVRKWRHDGDESRGNYYCTKPKIF